MPLDNPNELFYWVDENDQVLGKITRRKAHSGGNNIHRAVTVLVFTPDKREILLQQRSLQKDTAPGLWSDSVGGHVEFGQTYKEAAVRETAEELGLTNLTLTFHLKDLFKLEGEREYFAIFSTTIPKTTPIHFDPDEIQQVAWVKLADLPEFIRTHPCTSAFLQAWEKIKVRFPV